MKRILRIMVGLLISPFVMILSTYLWLFSDEETWVGSVGKFTWYLASGDWDKLPE
jgi:hypothetical protein